MTEKEKKRKGFFFSFHQIETILMLPPEQQEMLLIACYQYHKGETPEISNPKVAFAFAAFKEDFDAANNRYEEVCEKRRQAANARYNNANEMQKDANAVQMHCKCSAIADQEQEQEQVNNINTPNGVFVAATGDDAEAAGADNEKMPPCPHQEIVSLYHEILPELPRVKIWEGARKQHLQARWRDFLNRHNIRDKPGGIEKWRNFFVYVRKCPFLMGQRTNRDGRIWRADLPWLVKAENFAKVIEGKYYEQPE